MQQKIDVVFENGVLRPIGPPPEGLQERQRYTVTVESAVDRESRIDHACMAAAKQKGNAAIDIAEVRRILANISGTLTQAVIEEREER